MNIYMLSIKTSKRFTCASENHVYIIPCSGCYENYIGQTSNTIRKMNYSTYTENSSPAYKYVCNKNQKHWSQNMLK